MTLKIGFPSVEDLRWVFNGEWSCALVCSPWLPQKGIEMIKELINKSKISRKLEIWFRVTPNDVVDGQWTDVVGIQEWIEYLEDEINLEVTLRSMDLLHAKIYATDKRAFISSANLSAFGFQLKGTNGNLEIGIQLNKQEDIDELWSFIEDAKERMEVVPKSTLATIAAALKKEPIQQSIAKIEREARKIRTKIVETSAGDLPHLHYPLR